MPSQFPAGRCGTNEFCRLSGLSKTLFFTRYRHDARYIELFDIRVDALGRLNLSARAARRFGEQRAGKRVHGNAGRFPSRACPACTQKIHPAAKTCPFCHEPVPKKLDCSSGAAVSTAE